MIARAKLPKPASRPSPDTAPVIATRTLKAAGSRRKAVVTVRMPVQVGEDEWHCTSQITGMEKAVRGYGVDAVQALQVALVGIRLELNRAKGRYTWIGGKPGDHGFPHLVMHGLGAVFEDRMEQVIEREITDYVRAERRRRRAKRRQDGKT
jgi:hypothetical protein